MPEAAPVLVPLISANEPEAQVVSVEVADGAWVDAGAVLAVVENTKSAVDVEAPGAGHVAGLAVTEGDPVRAGDVLCWLAPQPGWTPPASTGGRVDRRAPDGGAVPEGLRISAPALEHARALGLDLTDLPIGPVVTRAMVDAVADTGSAGPTARWLLGDHAAVVLSGGDDAVVVLGPGEPLRALPGPVLVYGGGGHGRQVIDALAGVPGVVVAAVVDDVRPPGDDVLGVPVRGGGEVLGALVAGGVALAVNAVGGIADPSARGAVFDRLADAGLLLPAVVHPSAVVEPSAAVSAGSQVFARAYVGSAATVGAGAIVNTAAVVSHDCVVEAGANVSPGALLGGGVHVGRQALVGMGVTVNLGVTIGAGARVGNGATIKADVPDGGVVRAGTAWPA